MIAIKTINSTLNRLVADAAPIFNKNYIIKIYWILLFSLPKAIPSAAA
jgi:hypothetical protein